MLTESIDDPLQELEPYSSEEESLLDAQVYSLTCQIRCLSKERQQILSHLTTVNSCISQLQTKLTKVEYKLFELRGKVTRDHKTPPPEFKGLRSEVSTAKITKLILDLDAGSRQRLVADLQALLVLNSTKW